MDSDTDARGKSPAQPRSGFMHILGKSLDYATPAAISVGLVVWLFQKVKFHEIVEIVRQGCEFRWLVLMMVITTLSHMIRGIRWGIQLRAAGVERMPVVRESVAIFGAYALNLVFPRLGEAWRCMYISRREKVPLSTVVGTDLGDRGSDLVVVIALFILSLIVAHHAMEAFISHYALGRDIDHIIKDPLLWIGISAAVAAAWSVLHYFRRIKWVQKVGESIHQMWGGFKVLFTMNGKTQYVLLTLGIWICYYLETYVTFFAFPFTRELITQPGLAYGLVPGLVVFVFGSFSMAVPSNGGLGPWNLAVMFALTLYGVSDAQGTAFSMVMWSSQAACLVVLGLFSVGYILWDNKHRQTKSEGS
ncbi:MAG: flippase-like domain-containing protein [Clostridium sp.]|nr:flippase-like domain-containing protein [Clostridium sp.]